MAKRRVHRSQDLPTVTRGGPPSQTPKAPKPKSTTDASGKSDRRRRFETASAPWLAQMAALPAFLVPAIMGIALFLGLVLTNPLAGLLLIAVAAFLAWLGALSWPNLAPMSRVLRSLITLGIGAMGILRLFGLW